MLLKFGSNLTFKILSVIFLIINASSLVISWHSYYNDYDYNNNNNNYGPSSYIYNRQIIHNQCKCIKLKYCASIRDIISKETLPLSDAFKTQIRTTQCGYENNEPLVCCPLLDPRMRRSSYYHKDESTEQPWVWDVEENVNDNDNYHQDCGHDHNQFPGFYHSHTLNNRFYPQPKYREFHPHFEDARTRKNCPPSFSKEFVIPATVVGVKPVTNPPLAVTPALVTAVAAPPTVPANPPSVTEVVVSTGDNVIIQDRVTKKTLINTALCGLSVNTRIIGGEDAGPGQFPWMARLAYRNRTSSTVSYRCAGSVISDRYVLTAAHCVSNLITTLEVVMIRLGELDSRTDVDCTADQSKCTESQDFGIEKIIAHSLYDTPKYANDIALIRLIQAIPASTFISPLCLPVDVYAAADVNLTGSQGIISGWGSMTAASNNPSPILQWVRLPIVDTTACATSYATFSANSRVPIIVSQQQLCVQGRENMDACQGDSGGPLMSEGVSGAERYTLLGLVSFGPRTCGVSNFPGVYTRISSYIDWIIDNMEM